MTRSEYLETILRTYQVVHILSDKNDCCTLHLRHRKQQRDLVVRSFSRPIDAYETLCRYRCENLPLVYDVIKLDDGQIVLEEYIDGMSLADSMVLRRYDYKETKKVLRAVCEALTFLHERQLVHRDIKPENIMIDSNGRVVLIDFNASRAQTTASKDTVMMGTVGYASPEQLGISQSDARTDIYAVGVLLNVMITGKHPSKQLANGKAGRIVQKCTNVSPDERYQSAEKLSKAL